MESLRATTCSFFLLWVSLDLTLRDKQSALRAKGLPWTLSKSFQGSSILGPLVPLSEFYEQGGKDFSPDSLSFELRVNDDVRQKASVAQMIFPVPHLLTFLATYQPLEPGDLVYTGTPKGVNTMVKGDEFAMSWLTNDDKRGYSGTYEGVL